MTQPNEPTFARPYSKVVDHGVPEEFSPQEGLTKREYFAAMAMQGILGNRELQIACAYDYKGENKNDAVSEYSVQQADALIKALNKQL
jgi:hypothetical protein